MKRGSLPMSLTTVGLILIGSGLSIPVLGLYALLNAFLFIVALGVILTFVGLVLWARRSTVSECRGLSAILLVGGIACYCVAVSDVHIWGLFFLMAIPAALLGLVLLVMSLLDRPHPQS